MVVVDPPVVEAVATKFAGRQIPRGHPNRTVVNVIGQDRLHIGCGTAKFRGEAIRLGLEASGENPVLLIAAR
jgi:hypothetical protein